MCGKILLPPSTALSQLAEDVYEAEGKGSQGAAFSWSLDRVMLSLHRAAQCHPHPSSITGRLAEPAGCRVLSCCPLVVLENVGPSQFLLLSRAESEEGDFSSGTGRPRRPHHSLSQAAVGLAAQQQN